MGEEEKLDEIKQILQDACDRDWEDESLFSTASIAANGLYWRGKEIERQRENIKALQDELRKAADWMDSCAKRERGVHVSHGYHVRIIAARAALGGAKVSP